MNVLEKKNDGQAMAEWKPDEAYWEWLKQVKKEYHCAQIRASTKVNSELLKFYWNLGKEISERYPKSTYGSAFYIQLSQDLRKRLGSNGFSASNLNYIARFYLLYKDVSKNIQQVVDELASVPWGHHCLIINRCQKPEEALFFVKETIENGWSRSVLMNFLDTDLYQRKGKALTNFSKKLPAEESELAQEMTKSPYTFDFLCLNENYREKE